MPPNRQSSRCDPTQHRVLFCLLISSHPFHPPILPCTLRPWLSSCPSVNQVSFFFVARRCSRSLRQVAVPFKWQRQALCVRRALLAWVASSARCSLLCRSQRSATVSSPTVHRVSAIFRTRRWSVARTWWPIRHCTRSAACGLSCPSRMAPEYNDRGLVLLSMATKASSVARSRKLSNVDFG